MSDERLTVLQMLADGRITTEEADRLLAALDAPPSGPARRRAEEEVAGHGRQSGRQQPGMGGLSPNPEQWAALRAVGVTPDYIRELRDAGLVEADAEQFVALKGVGVDAAYIGELRELGIAEPDADQLVALKGVGVDAAYVHSLRDAGITGLDADQLIAMKGSGVDAAYARDLRDAGH